MNIPTQMAAVLLGLLGGALLLIAMGLVPYWQSLDPTEFTELFRENSPIIAGIMMPLGFTAAGLTWLATVLAVWKKLPSRYWLIAASVCALCMLITFPIYFRETNAALAGSSMIAPEIVDELIQWQRVHWVRTSAAIVGCFCAVRAGYAKSA